MDKSPQNFPNGTVSVANSTLVSEKFALEKWLHPGDVDTFGFHGNPQPIPTKYYLMTT